MVRDVLADRAREAPDASPLLDAVRERVADDHPRVRAGMLAAAAVLTVAATATGAWWPSGTTSTTPATFPATSTAGPAGAPLVPDGECADLTVRVEAARRSDGSSGHTLGQVRRGDNALTITGNQLVHLRAAGACVDRLSYDIVDVAGRDSLQGASGVAGQQLDADGIGLLVSHADQPSRARVELFLGCGEGPSCAASRRPVATITVTIRSPFVAEATTVPPSVTVTTTQESGGFTTQVSPAPPAGQPVTVTVTGSP
jgi:hypothetical protein